MAHRRRKSTVNARDAEAGHTRVGRAVTGGIEGINYAFPCRDAESVVSEDKTKERQGVERPAAIQHRLETPLRDAREIRAALTRLSVLDPFAVLHQRGLDHRRPNLADSLASPPTAAAAGHLCRFSCRHTRQPGQASIVVK
jgi:hypothetical protein